MYSYCNVFVMSKKLHLLQIKLSEDMLRAMDKMIEEGLYLNRSEIIRDALRQLILKKPTKKEK